MSARREVEIAVVGGGPAGAAAAALLAADGHEVVVFERLPAPRWRASGVYSSPLTRRRLRAVGLDEEQLARLIRPISAMVVEAADGSAAARLEHEPPDHGCGVDRVRLESALIEHARTRGALVHEAAVVQQVHLATRGSGLLVSRGGSREWWRARLVVGADGPGSLVARAAGAAIPTRRFRRAALTGHRADGAARPPDQPMEARLVIGRGWYLGVAPVPGRRVNLGLVLGEGQLRAGLATGGTEAVLESALRSIAGPAAGWLDAAPTDQLQAHLPLTHRVARSAGRGWLLVGDAAGFIDPITGDGLHRALASAEMAASAARAWLRGDGLALGDYDRRLRARFRGKDIVSWLLQLFLFQPELAGYALRRLARRDSVRRTFARGLADRRPASELVDPRFHLRLLAP